MASENIWKLWEKERNPRHKHVGQGGLTGTGMCTNTPPRFGSQYHPILPVFSMHLSYLQLADI